MERPHFDVDGTRAQSEVVIRSARVLIERSIVLIDESKALATLHREQLRALDARATALGDRAHLPWPPSRG